MTSFDPLLALILAVTTLLVTFTLSLAPKLSSAAVRLGVRVPEKHRSHPVVAQQEEIFKKRQLTAGTLAVLVAIPLSIVPWLGALISLVPVAYFVWNINQAGAAIRRTKQEEGWFQGVRTAVAGEISAQPGAIDVTDVPGYPHRAGAITGAANIAGFAALLLAAAYAAIHWNSIPDHFATHFGAGFKPDAWSDKTIGSVFFPTFFGVAMLALLAVLYAWLLRVSLPARADSSLRGKIEQEITLRLSAAWLAVLNLVLALMFAALQVFMVLPDLMRWIPAVIVASLAAVIVTALAMVVGLTVQRSALTSAVKSYTERVASEKEATAEGRDNDEHYKWGMFYHNPDDPAVMVEKRFGVGVDFNYAHWQGKAFLVVVALLVVVPLLLVFLL